MEIERQRPGRAVVAGVGLVPGWVMMALPPVVIRPSPVNYWRSTGRNMRRASGAVALLWAASVLVRVIGDSTNALVAAWTFGVILVLVGIVLPLGAYASTRLTLDGHQLCHRRCWRTWRVDLSQIRMTSLDAGVRTSDPQLVFVDGFPATATRKLHLAYWPADLEKVLRAAGAQAMAEPESAVLEGAAKARTARSISRSQTWI